MAAMFAGRFATGAALEVAEAMRGAPPSPSPRGPDLLLDGFAVMITEGHRTGAPLLKRAVHAFRNDDVVANGGFRWLFLAEMAAIEVWDYDAWRELTVREMQLVRDAGALTVLATALSVFIYVHIFAGELAVAARKSTEQRMITEASGSRLAPHAALILAAWRGRETDLQDLVEETIREVVPRGEGIGLSATQWVRALLHNGHGHYESALAAAQQLMEPPRRFDQAIGWALPELIEAAIRNWAIGYRPRRGRPAFGYDAPGGTDWGLGLEARCRALLSEHEEAEHLYRDAIERLGRTRLRRSTLGRTCSTASGCAARIAGSTRASNCARRTTMFTTIGMEAFAERARGELLARAKGCVSATSRHAKI